MKPLRKTMVVVLLASLTVAFGWYGFPQHTAKAASVLVSRIIKTNEGKSYLEVDGQPYLYDTVQTPAIQTASNDLKDPAVDLPDAAAANYKTVAFWLRWAALEPSQGTWDFSTLDTMLNLANYNGLRLDIVWGGTDFGGSMNPAFTPSWVSSNPAYQAKNASGQPLNYNSYTVADYTNTTLLGLEQGAFTQVMNHLASVDTTHRVIFIQLENEATLTPLPLQEVYDYINQLGKTIHTSSYQIATRVNLPSGSTLQPLIDQESDLDAQGVDPYSMSVSEINTLISDTTEDTKFHYIPENAGYDNSTSLMATAFAAGGFYSIYKVEYDSYWHAPGLYGPNYSVTHATTSITNWNAAANKIGSIIAVSPAFNMVTFNTGTDAPSSNYNVTKNLQGTPIGFQSQNDAPVGLAVTQGGYTYLIADSPALFTFSSTPTDCEIGALDALGTWVSSGSCSGTRIQYTTGEAIRIAVHGGNNLLQNPGFETGNLNGWTTWTGTDGSGAGATYVQGKVGTLSPHSGAYNGVEWKSSAYEVSLYQCVSVPNGVYAASAWTASSGGQSAASFYVKDGNTNLASVNIPTGQSWQQVTLPPITITTGQACLVFYSKDAGGDWIIMDDVSLVQPA